MMSETNNTPTIDPKEARIVLWNRGLLRWKLDSTQKELYDLFYSSNHTVMTWLLSRRQGKTYTLCILAIEQCIKKPNSIVKFASPTKVQVNNNVRPILRQILEDCPNNIKPEFKHKDYIYYFPNGSEIQLAGTDNGHAEKLRGGDSDLFFVDEAGSCSGLDNLLKSILLPTTLITNGRGILASTPPKDSEHDFLKYIEESERRQSLIVKTIDDNPRITETQRQKLILELGGLESDECQRELFCKLIKDSKTSVIPEFTEDLAKEITKEWPKPPFFDAYEGMDVGGKDLTVVLFGYYDFRADKVIIEDELVADFQKKDENVSTLVKGINQKEKDLWTNPISKEYKAPHIRVSDIDYIFLQEIATQSKFLPTDERIFFQMAQKDDNDAAIQKLRIMFANRKIIIHPRCVTLLSHLKHVKWDKSKIHFARSTDNGHYDAVDALKYLIRTVEYKKNPYPAHYNYQLKDLFISNPNNIPQSNNQIDVFKKIFNIKRKF